jgi:hypothetical protein
MPCERRHRHDGWSLLMFRALVVACAALLAACSVGTDIGDSAFGVWVANDCAQPIHAKAAHTGEIAVERLASRPIEIPPGEGRQIDVIENAAAHPTAYFLALSVGDEKPLVRKFDLKRLKAEPVRVTFGADCATLVEQR